MSSFAARLGVEKAVKYLTDEDVLGMRRAFSALDMFRWDADGDALLTGSSSSTPPAGPNGGGLLKEAEEAEEAVSEDVEDAVFKGEGEDRSEQAVVASPQWRQRRASEATAPKERRRRSGAWGGAVRPRAPRLLADNKKRKSLPFLAARLFLHKGSASSSEEVGSGANRAASDQEEEAQTEQIEESSGNLSSTKSAPATPVGERLQQPVSTATPSNARRRAAGTPTVAPASSTPTLVPLPSPATSKARHKKFHRHFDSVAPDERVLNYYSCALISDILLQGHLYITNNYFAFYSNVFGYVTKLLIPTASVLKVSKEKTARIIPNAIGVATSDEKHVFGSLLSRDSTYKLMVQVWKTALGPPTAPPQPLALSPGLPKELKDEADSASASGDVLHEDDDSSLSGDAGLPPVPLDKMPIVAATCKASAASAASGAAVASASHAALGLGAGPALGPGRAAEARLSRSTSQTVVLGVSTALVAFLLLSTAFLFHRMACIQDQFRLQSGDNLYEDLARWQNHLHARSASQVEEFLNTHLHQLAKVRKSLEALTLLIVSNDDDRMQQADLMTHHHSPYRDQKQQSRPPLPQEGAKNS